MILTSQTVVKFNYYDKLQSIKIIAVGLDYALDSKGYYQPVYCFTAFINDDENQMNITIPALGK